MDCPSLFFFAASFLTPANNPLHLGLRTSLESDLVLAYMTYLLLELADTGVVLARAAEASVKTQAAVTPLQPQRVSRTIVLVIGTSLILQS